MEFTKLEKTPLKWNKVILDFSDVDKGFGDCEQTIGRDMRTHIHISGCGDVFLLFVLVKHVTNDERGHRSIPGKSGKNEVLPLPGPPRSGSFLTGPSYPVLPGGRTGHLPTCWGEWGGMGHLTTHLGSRKCGVEGETGHLPM